MAVPLCCRSQSPTSIIPSPPPATTSTPRFIQAAPQASQARAQPLLSASFSPPRFQHRADHHHTITPPPPVHEPVLSCHGRAGVDLSSSLPSHKSMSAAKERRRREVSAQRESGERGGGGHGLWWSCGLSGGGAVKL
jgi:hypothetical protein